MEVSKDMTGLKLRSLGLACVTVAVSAVMFIAPGTASAAIKCGTVKLEANGSSLQANAQKNFFAKEYNAACGPTSTVEYESTSSGKGLKSWDVEPESEPPARKVPFRGFGPLNGFVGTDAPPNQSQENEIKAQGGGVVLSIPVLQAAVALPIRLPAECMATSGKGKKLEDRLALNDEVLQKIWSHELKTWTEVDAALAGYDDDTLTGSGCEKEITRVVRKEGSGTTSILKKFLCGINNKAFEPPVLATKGTWCEIAEVSRNLEWPEKSLAVIEAEKGSGVTQKVAETESSIGYANLNEVRENPAFGKAPNGLLFWPTLQSKASKVQDPSDNGEQATKDLANCADETYITLNKEGKEGKFPPPKTSALWNEVTASKAQKKSYPLCGFTYDVSLTDYEAFSAVSLTAVAPWTGMTSLEEAETVKDYLSYVTAKEEGQKLIGELAKGTDFYPLPEGKKGENVQVIASEGAKEIAY
jgi:ABC-type phosphate transport system substrate-binding protein